MSKRIVFDNLPPPLDETEREKELQRKLTRMHTLKAVEQMKVWNHEDAEKARGSGLRKDVNKRKSEAKEKAEQVRRLNDELLHEGKNRKERIKEINKQFGISESTFDRYIKKNY